MSHEQRAAAAGIEIPRLVLSGAKFLPAVRSGNLIFASGQTPTKAGELSLQGKLGVDISVEEGMDAARLAALNCLAGIRDLLGSLDRVRRVVKLNGYVASAPGFVQQPLVINGASQLLQDVFGEAGMHARVSLGVAELPGGAPVEVELIVEVAD